MSDIDSSSISEPAGEDIQFSDGEDDNEEEEEEDHEDDGSASQMSESEDSNSDTDMSENEVDALPNIKAIYRNMITRVLSTAASSGTWEEAELARVVVLLRDSGVAGGYRLTKNELKKVLIHTSGLVTAELLVCLADHAVHFSPTTMLYMLRVSTGDAAFQAGLTRILETGLFALDKSDVVNALYEEAYQIMNLPEDSMLRFMIICCSHTRTKRVAGRIVDRFTADLLDAKAVTFAYEVCTMEWFLDLRGDINGFYRELREPLGDLVKAKFDAQGGFGYESDADADGNLEGFVVAEASDIEDEEGEDDDNDDDDDDDDDDKRRPVGSKKRGAKIPENGKGGKCRRVVESSEEEEEEEEEEGEEGGESGDSDSSSSSSDSLSLGWEAVEGSGRRNAVVGNVEEASRQVGIRLVEPPSDSGDDDSTLSTTAWR